jgi:hypothetical protein
MPENPYQSPEPERMSARKITGFILAVTAIFLFFRLVEWQFGERAHVYTLVAVMLSLFAVNAWLRRR